MSRHTEKYDRAKACVDNCIRQWNKTTLSDLEKYGRKRWLIYGMIDAFLYFLSIDEYNDIKEYIWQQYGLNVGGTSGDMLESNTKEAADDKTDNSDTSI